MLLLLLLILILILILFVMTKKNETGAAPVSKYAAKKAARVNNVVETDTPDVSPEENETVVEAIPANTPAPSHRKPKKSFDRTIKTKRGEVDIEDIFPEHYIQIALIIKNNAEIRRFTSIGILNYLLQKGIIKGDNRYVSFKWNKFTVKCNGLVKEYYFNEPFFLNALVAAFSSFSASAQRTINNFCQEEMNTSLDKAVNVEEINQIVALNEEYQSDDSAETAE